MGKVKQAIQEVEEEVVSLVRDKLNLKEVKAWLRMRTDTIPNDNPYMSDEKLIEQSFNKAVCERDNEEPYPTEDEIYKRYVYPLSSEEIFKDAVNKKEIKDEQE